MATATMTRMADTMPMTVTMRRVCSVHPGRRRVGAVAVTRAP